MKNLLGGIGMLEISDATIARLRSILDRMRNWDDPVMTDILRSREAVLERFQPVFSSANVGSLSVENMSSFLLFRNNRHWGNLHRQTSNITRNPEGMRVAVRALLDETRPVAERFDEVDGMRIGIGKAIATAILTVAYPDKYGVWNNTSENGLIYLGLWPEREHNESPGHLFERINAVLTQLRDELETDFWSLDACWWAAQGDFTHAGQANPGDQGEQVPGAPIGGELRQTDYAFSLERHLQEFLHDNWEATEFGADWEIWKDEGGEECGVEFPCPSIGRIDILARHRRENRILVIELKRNQSNDQTVAQALRYMGWVKENLADSAASIEGIIISRSQDESLRLAISMTPMIKVMLYKVHFRLEPSC